MSRHAIEMIDAHSLRVERIWRDLEARARPPYFLSWGWIENWLACLPGAEAPRLAVISDGGEPIAAFFLGDQHLVRHHLLPSHALFFNTTGLPRRDDLCIEHNRMLRAPGQLLPLATLVELLPDDWDEVFLPGLDPDAFPDLGAPDGTHPYRVRIDHEVASPFVDLARVRAAPGGYLALLAANTRAQIRRARRGLGELQLEVADDLAHAFEIYDDLVGLHQERWRERGEAGAFADPWFDRFHRRLVAERLPHGEIQLLRVRSGGATVGCLYNLIAGGRVLFYQSGLARYDDPHVKAGYLCHAAAIGHNAAIGHDVYDLLGGDGRYKHCLSTSETRLVWARVQRPRARFAIEDRLRDVKHAALAWRTRHPRHPHVA
jgi:CelD/BcsL family acetyltransferase involved in cellulose biosynthesis